MKNKMILFVLVLVSVSLARAEELNKLSSSFIAARYATASTYTMTALRSWFLLRRAIWSLIVII